MPTVPTYDSPTVAQQAAPNARVQSDATPALLDTSSAATDVGRATQAFGQDITAITTYIQSRQNADLLFRAEAGIKSASAEFENDARQRKGVNAWDVTKDASKWWDDAATKYSEGLTNDAQKAAFGQTLTKLRTQSLISVSTHEANERRASLEEAGKASIVGSINSAAANYNSPGAVDDAVSDITKRMSVLSSLNGWTPERRDLETSSKLTSLHSQVLQNMVQESPEKAAQYLTDHRGQIDPTQYDVLGKLVRGAKFTTESQSFADTVMASGVSESEALTQTRAKYTGEEEKQVILEVKTRFAEKSQARERDQGDAADAAYKVYANTGRISAIPRATWDALDGRVQIALKNQAEVKAQGKAVKTDPNAYYDLRKLAADDPAAFQKLDLRGYFDKLDEGDREKFINLQNDVKHPAKQKDVVTLDGQLSNAHDSLGWTAHDGPKKGAFDMGVSNAIDAETDKKGKPLDYKERQQVIDRYMMDGKVPGTGFLGFGSGKKFYEVAGTNAEGTFIPKVPDVEKQKIKEAYARRGLPVPSDTDIANTYRKKNGL